MNDSVIAPSGTSAVPRLGPPLWAPAAAFAVLTLAAALLGANTPRVGANPTEISAYMAQHPTLLTVHALVTFGSAFPLAVLTVAVRHRLGRLGVAVPGPTFGLAGGLLAAAAIMLSALCTWACVHAAAIGEPVAAAVLRTLAFATGAFGFVAPLGLMLIGFAVPMLLRHLTPSSVAWAGIVLGALGVLAMFAMALPALIPLLPIGRFGPPIWLLVVASTLPVSRRRPRTTQSQRAGNATATSTEPVSRAPVAGREA